MSTKKEQACSPASVRRSNMHNYHIDMPTKKYSKIRYETRKELIRRVVKQKETLISVAKDLGLKLSTSKFIVKSFKKQGRIFKKRSMGEDSEYSTFEISETESRSPQQSVPCPQYFVYPYFVFNQFPPNFLYPQTPEFSMIPQGVYFQNPNFI